MPSSSLIYKIRDKLNSLPPEYCSDEQIYQDINDAYSYIIPKLKSTIDAEDIRVTDAVVALATFFTYLNYLSLATMQFNNVPVLANVKLNSYREIALALIRDLSDLIIADDLSIDIQFYNKLRPGVGRLGGTGWD